MSHSTFFLFVCLFTPFPFHILIQERCDIYAFFKELPISRWEFRVQSLHPNIPREICSKARHKQRNFTVMRKHKQVPRKSRHSEEGVAALNYQVEQREILQHFISLFCSMKTNSWHLEAIWSRSMELTPVVICLTALGGGQGTCVHEGWGWRGLVDWGLMAEQPGDGNSRGVFHSD